MRVARCAAPGSATAMYAMRGRGFCTATPNASSSTNGPAIPPARARPGGYHEVCAPDVPSWDRPRLLPARLVRQPALLFAGLSRQLHARAAPTAPDALVVRAEPVRAAGRAGPPIAPGSRLGNRQGRH